MDQKLPSESEIVKTSGSHPLFTVFFFGGIIAAIVICGSMVSKNRSTGGVADMDSAPRIQNLSGRP